MSPVVWSVCPEPEHQQLSYERKLRMVAGVFYLAMSN